MGDGNQYLDIIILGVIAAFIILRLRSVLGRRDGSEDNHNYHDPFRREGPEHGAPHGQPGPKDDNVVPLPGQKSPQPEFDPYDDRAFDTAAPVDEVVDESDPIAVGVADIRRYDPAFSPTEFLSGARVAFEVILNAFTQGDQATLKSLLSAEVYGNFSQALDERERAGETLEETLIGISKAELVEAGMEDSDATVSVQFVTEQINCTRNADGEVVDGDPSAVITVTDIWTFARDTRSRDPNWFLVGTDVPE